MTFIRHCQNMAKTAKTDDNSGFTLLEVLVGMMIFAVGITGVLCMEVIAINGHARARDFVQEVHLTSAQNELVSSSFGKDDYQNPSAQGAYGGLANSDPEAGDEPHQSPAGDCPTATYGVQQNNLVSGMRLIIMQNQRETPGARPYLLRSAEPNFYNQD